jgi:hypothetical protein
LAKILTIFFSTALLSAFTAISLVEAQTCDGRFVDGEAVELVDFQGESVGLVNTMQACFPPQKPQTKKAFALFFSINRLH